MSDPQTTSAGVNPRTVCRHCKEPGHFKGQCNIMELGAVVQIPNVSVTSLDWVRTNHIPVRIQGDKYHSLKDSGCNQTSIHKGMIQGEALGAAHVAKVLCVNRDVQEYPLVPVHLYFHGTKYSVEEAVNLCLTCPLILGTDWLGLRSLMESVGGSCSSMILGNPGVALAGEVLSEPSTSAPCHSDMRGSVPALPSLREFPLRFPFGASVR